MPKRIAPAVCAGVLILGASFAASAATLEVGPGRRFARIEEANRNARPGDVVLIFPLKDGAAYEAVAVYVDKKQLTFRGVLSKDGARVSVSGKGFDYSGVGRTPRAIFQFNRGADGCVLENLELSGAHNDSHNGAGVRISQANDVTVRNCDIHNNDMGVMSNGDKSLASAVNQRFEFCLIHHNGDPGEPGYNHNLYLGGTSVTLFGCEVYASLTGHNVKSRAHLTRVEASYIHDSANREFDLVEADETAFPGSHAVIVGCVIVKDPKCSGNRAVIHFGQDGGRQRDGTLYLVHNTIVTPFMSPVAELSTSQAHAEFINNIIHDAGSGQRGQVLVAASRGGASVRNASGSHNWLLPGFAPLPEGFPAGENLLSRSRLSFASPAKHNWRLVSRDAEVVDTGLAWDKIDLAPLALPGSPRKDTSKHGFSVDWQYKHPAQAEPRVDKGRPDLGAYAWAAKP